MSLKYLGVLLECDVLIKNSPHMAWKKKCMASEVQCYWISPIVSDGNLYFFSPKICLVLSARTYYSLHNRPAQYEVLKSGIEFFAFFGVVL